MTYFRHLDSQEKESHKEEVKDVIVSQDNGREASLRSFIYLAIDT